MAMVGAALAGALSGTALAADPKSNGKPVGDVGGTGVAAGSMPSGFDAGITSDQKAAKKQDLDRFKAAVSAETKAKQGGIAPARTPIYVPKDAVYWTRGFHQQTSYYCVVAVVQTMAYQDISSYFRLMGTGSVRAAQDKIYALIKDPYVPGSDDWLGLRWINQQYANNGLSWRYDASYPATFADFIWQVKYDITLHKEGSYIRVDLSSGYYAWKQSRVTDASGNLRIPEHATMSIGFDDNVNSITSYDPFVWTTGSGTCSTAYQSGPSYEWACNWTLSQTRYYNSMDRAYSAGDPPFWW